MVMLLILIVFLLLSYSFFYGMEVAYISSNRLRLELESSSERWTDRSLKYLFEHQPQLLASLYLWARVSFVFLILALFSYFSQFVASAEWCLLFWVVPLTLVLLFLSVNLALSLVSACNPTSTFRFFSLFLTLLVFISYPFVSLLFSLARMFKINMDEFSPFNINVVSNDKDGADDFVAEGNEAADDVDDEVRMFQNALDFPMSR